MVLVLSIIFFLAIYVAILFLVISIRPMPLSGALGLAFACLISFEAVVLNGLSLFHLVNRAGLLFHEIRITQQYDLKSLCCNADLLC